jgi:spore germination protein GerM
MTRRLLQVAAAIALFALLAWGATRLLERLFETDAATIAAPPPVVVADTPHIQATLFYATTDGLALTAVRRDVPLAADPLAQGRVILNQQLEPAPSPFVSVIPPGTTLRGFYLTDGGDAFVDLSREAITAHPGGSFLELLTVQALVQSVTSSLPSARRVQILVEGEEVETLAGHVDLRRPIAPDPSVVRGRQ